MAAPSPFPARSPPALTAFARGVLGSHHAETLGYVPEHLGPSSQGGHPPPGVLHPHINKSLLPGAGGRKPGQPVGIKTQQVWYRCCLGISLALGSRARRSVFPRVFPQPWLFGQVLFIQPCSPEPALAARCQALWQSPVLGAGQCQAGRHEQGVSAANPSFCPLPSLHPALPAAGILQEATGAASPAAVDTATSRKAATQRGELTPTGSGPSDLAPDQRGTSIKQGVCESAPGAAGREPAGTGHRGIVFLGVPGRLVRALGVLLFLFLLLLLPVCGLVRAPSCAVLSAASLLAHLETVRSSEVCLGWQSRRTLPGRRGGSLPPGTERGLPKSSLRWGQRRLGQVRQEPKPGLFLPGKAVLQNLSAA